VFPVYGPVPLESAILEKQYTTSSLWALAWLPERVALTPSPPTPPPPTATHPVDGDRPLAGAAPPVLNRKGSRCPDWRLLLVCVRRTVTV